MVKTPTQWKMPSGSDTVTNANAGYFPLLETGSRILLETPASSRVLLEDTVVTPKIPIAWATL